MLFDDLTCAGAADAGTGDASGNVGAALEAVEDRHQFSRGYANAFILDRNQGALSAVLCGVGLDPSTPVGKLTDRCLLGL